MTNPWLNIPASDYEGHMGSPDVMQTDMLSDLFRSALQKHDCSYVLLPGCATGNGLKHIDSSLTKKVTAVDINPRYLEILSQRYMGRIENLEVLQGDLASCELDSEAYSLVFAGLLFEYLSPERLLKKLARCLKPNGHMVSVLQLPSDKAQVTATPYQSLKALNSIMNLVNEEDYNRYALEAGLSVLDSHVVTLPTGKFFAVCTHMKEKC